MIPLRTKRPTFSFIERRLSGSTLKKVLQLLERTQRRNRLLQNGDSVVVGVSGGSDSVALLHLLVLLRRKYRLKLFIAHLDHGLYVRQAARQAALVRGYARSLGVPAYFHSASIRPLSRRFHKSLEETGRIERYRFFQRIAARVGAGKIATAHTLDDQAETVLMRIIRGGGVRGMAAIPAKRLLEKSVGAGLVPARGRPRGSPLQIIRPFIDIPKKDLLNFLKENNLRHAEDASNRDTDFMRNRVRHELLPLLEKKFNPQIRKTLVAWQEISALTQTYLNQQAQAAFRRCSVTAPTNGSVRLDLAKLDRLPEALLREVIFQAIAVRKGNFLRPGHEHITAILDMLRSNEAPLEQHLPEKLTVRKNARLLEVI